MSNSSYKGNKNHVCYGTQFDRAAAVHIRSCNKIE